MEENKFLTQRWFHAGAYSVMTTLRAMPWTSQSADLRQNWHAANRRITLRRWQVHVPVWHTILTTMWRDLATANARSSRTILRAVNCTAPVPSVNYRSNFCVQEWVVLKYLYTTECNITVFSVFYPFTPGIY